MVLDGNYPSVVTREIERRRDYRVRIFQLMISALN